MNNKIIIAAAGILMFSAAAYTERVESAVDFDNLPTKTVVSQSIERAIDMTELQVLPTLNLSAETVKNRQEEQTELVFIPAGEFFMGSPDGEGYSDEHPRHKVYLDSFYIDKYEATAGQYRKFAQATGREMLSQPNYSADNYPVVNVDWTDAAAYCQWAGKRLPTEAEWEKAARGGTDTTWSFGDNESQLEDYAWYNKNCGGKMHPVGQRKPNQYGLYDTYGNVWEWVADWYDKDYYKTCPERNPKGPDSGTSRVVLRGGSCYSNISFTRAPYRYTINYDYFNSNFGFRCALTR